MHGVLQGKKTYVTAALGAIGFIAGYLTGEIGIAEAANGILTAVLAVTIRAGIKADTK